MAALTTPFWNTATGMPAAGMRIELKALEPPMRISPIICVTNADGRSATPLLQAEQFQVGRYSLTFDVAAYFRSINVSLADPPFLERVVIAFGISDAGQNYHVPLLISPWSYSTYRGS
jgi:5-hydroxyisourate hydrolase